MLMTRPIYAGEYLIGRPTAAEFISAQSRTCRFSKPNLRSVTRQIAWAVGEPAAARPMMRN
jgi:hypothetical protein